MIMHLHLCLCFMTFHANDIVVDLYKSWKQICKFYKVMDTWGNCIFVCVFYLKQTICCTLVHNIYTYSFTILKCTWYKSREAGVSVWLLVYIVFCIHWKNFTVQSDCRTPNYNILTSSEDIIVYHNLLDVETKRVERSGRMIWSLNPKLFWHYIKIYRI